MFSNFCLCITRKVLTEEKKRREEAEKEKQELQDRLKQYEEERERQASQLEETLQKSQELERKAQVRNRCRQSIHDTPAVSQTCLRSCLLLDACLGSRGAAARC